MPPKMNSGVAPLNQYAARKVTRAGIKRVAGRIPPGLAKKPGMRPPGQYKKPVQNYLNG